MKSSNAIKMVGANPEQGRHKNDFYPTPPEATNAHLRFLNLPKDTVIWEPAAGEGDMVQAIWNWGYITLGTDIQFGYDFLTEPMKPCDWIITNPPFSLAEEFIKRCIEHEKPFALLLKSQFWHARKRLDLFREHPPAYICPLTWRPDFLFKEHGDKHSSPLMDVMWCIWIPHITGHPKYAPLSKDLE